MTKILYVEDNEDNIYMLSRRLKKRGYEVIVAKDGEKGVQLAMEKMPDLIIMDLDLPAMDGLDATRILKQDPKFSHIPIIILSAHAMEGVKSDTLSAGADDYDTKPVNITRLMGKIEKFLKSDLFN